MTPPEERTSAVAREIARDVYCLGPRGRSQTDVYFVRSGSSWTLIDAGWARDGPSIKQAAESVFGADTRPASILLTHHHPDHAGAALQLARTWDCAVYVHPYELPLATGDFAAMTASAGPLDPLGHPAAAARHGAAAARGGAVDVEPRRRRARVRTERRGPGASRLAMHPHAGPHAGPRFVLPNQ